MKLPDGTDAIVDMVKLRDYCLNPDHPHGRHKARVFHSTMGIERAHARQLRDALMRAATDLEAVEVERSAHGRRFMIDFEMTGPSGAARVRSAWIIRPGEATPRLTTCFVLL